MVVKWHLIVVLIFTLVMNKGVKYLFMCLLALCMCFFWQMSIQILFPYNKWVIFYYWIVIVLSILYSRSVAHQFSSVQLLSHIQLSVTHGLQHARLSCPSPTPRACPNSCPSSQWCHPTISVPVIPFPYLQSLPASVSYT